MTEELLRPLVLIKGSFLKQGHTFKMSLLVNLFIISLEFSVRC